MAGLIALIVAVAESILPGIVVAAWRYWRDTKPARKLVDPYKRKAMLVIYSTVVMTNYCARNGRNIQIEHDRAIHGEGVVSSYGDVLGYFQLRALSIIAGLRESSVSGKTCDQMVDEDWEKNLILLGSPISNSKIELVLRDCGYEFDGETKCIRCATDPDKQWYANGQFDYCIVARKLNRQLRYIYIAIAGIGPLGTQAGCHYLAHCYRQLMKRYRDSQFAVVLKVDRQIGYSSWQEVDSLHI